MRIKVPAQRNRKLRDAARARQRGRRAQGLWHVSNVNAVKRLGINDHSWVHIQIVANIGAAAPARSCTKRGVEPAMVADYGMKQRRRRGGRPARRAAPLHRHGGPPRPARGLEPLPRRAEAAPAARTGLYEEPELTVVVSEVLQAITSHREYGHPLTLEAGIVRVADALDIEEGRSRIPFERGRVSIHSISAAAIDEVIISDGEDAPGLDRDQDEQLGRHLPGGRAAEVEAARLRASSRTSEVVRADRAPRPRRASSRCTASE